MSGTGGAKRAVLIAGPTASGKSALALALAERHGGMVINADSMQVYRDLRVITARPTPEEETRAPHCLYGHVDAAENYSVGRYVADAAHAIASARERGLLPILIGGTGLYFRALTRGLAAIPPVPAAVRDEIRGAMEARGAQALHAELARRDSALAARLSPTDRTRIARALEVLAATGRSLAEWQRDEASPVLGDTDLIAVFLAPARADLRRRIEARFDDMLARGALDEARALAARKLAPLLPAMKAHGIPWLIRHLAGDTTLAQAAQEAKADTRRYAKRQFTWFRHQLPDWPHISPEAAAEHLERRLKAPQGEGPGPR